MVRFQHPRSERVLRRIAFVVKTGVLGWGVTCAVAMFVALSFQSGAWIPPWDFVLMVLIYGFLGLLFGLRHLCWAASCVPDGADRCTECGDVRPRHTRWCTAGASARTAA
jgi:hypothetical protein